MGSMVSAISYTIVSLIITFTNRWKLALVGLTTIPLATYGQLVEVNALSDINDKTKKPYLKVSQIAMESIVNMRTASSLSREQVFYNDYLNRVDKTHKLTI